MLELFGMFVLALAPIIWLVIALCGLHMEAYVASVGALVVAIVCAMLGWGMSAVNMATAALEGFAMAFWPIVIVIIAAVFTYNLTVHTGAMETIKRMLCSVSADKRLLTLLIGWCFGGFLEGMAGFGTAVAIPASMLMALGINPVTAILACLVANGVPTMFGSIGIPTTTLASITGIDQFELAFTQAIQVFPFVVACPILMVIIVGDGPKALKGAIPAALVAGLSMAVPEVLAARFIGPALTDVVASVVSLAVTFAFCLRTKDHPVPEAYLLSTGSTEGAGSAADAPTETVADQLRAWSPFALIFVVLLATSQLFPFIHDPLSQFTSTVNIYAGDPTATLTFTWVNTPGVLIMICGIVGGIIQRCPAREMVQVFVDTCKQMSKTVITMLGVLACAKIMSYSGMIASIAAFFVAALGPFYPLVAPLLGALGTFVTGSGTSSEVLFGTVQQHAAEAIGTDPTWLVASNSLGVSAGKMLSPQNIAIGCASCGLTGKDGEILGKIAKYAFAFAICMSVLVYVGTLVLG
ncbi:L-lactate permease [Olsenella profusa]|uniref:L-lactate permease n=1 Tax=Olsenella profusa TaxID=138595 RepID=A0ABS2F0X6_9ACTN|nr:L-lactate permease [Olsenella profusa]MBM6774517.1 L-lactate permease [Olsenella profusa]